MIRHRLSDRRASLDAKGLVQDSGLRRLGKLSGRYEIVWDITYRAVKRYGTQLRSPMP